MPTYPDQVRAAERAAIRKRRSGAAVPMAALRVAELDRLFAARYGATLPDDDSGIEDITIVMHHLAHRSGDAESRMSLWLAQHAPWMSVSTRLVLVAAVIDKPLRWRADTLARRLNLTSKDRQRLCIRTIGAVDLTAENRASLRRLHKRLLKEAKRRAAGSLLRSDYESTSTEKKKPWEAEGISRRTWYRRRQLPKGQAV